MRECQHCKYCYSDDVNICPNDGMPTTHTISGNPVLEGKYHLERRLGQGGMGVVYCAKHAYLKTQHAIKVILPDLVGNDPQLVTRFRQEALAAAAIRHHNVVSVTDYGVAEGTMPFLVMEYVEGESLHDLLAREGRLAPEKALELMAAICNGIGAAHRQGIVHRDLKPLNIMILKEKDSMNEAVKILDFGLAKIKSGELLGSFIQAQTTGLMGSPYYMAPEQWADEEPDARADVYSLAVILYQMLAGDVPFKGSSIPAIMKKHLSDAPPPFAEMGVKISPQIELAVRHALEKDPQKRTPSVDVFVNELRSALGFSPQNIGAITSSNLPVSNLQVLTNPPQSKVFVDNVAVGESQEDGWLLLEGVQSGHHLLRVRHEGFQDWQDEVVCDGKPKQVVARLEKDTGSIPKPPVAPTVLNIQTDDPSTGFAGTQGGQSQPRQTAQQNWQTGEQSVSIESQPKKSVFSPLVLGIIGISGIFLLTLVGVTVAFMLGLIGRTTEPGNSNAIVSDDNTGVQPPPPEKIKAEMVRIPGGKFTMGRNDGADIERPEHEIEVKDFWMDKTEVTNAEYYEFIKEVGFGSPTHWLRGRPVPGEENMPVRYVSLNDAKTFAAWRSRRDEVTYRLPTEEEWEYAARNGGENNLYPWGDNWDSKRAVVRSALNFEPVGSKPEGANKWGVMDLIGNVWEWTSSELKPYPGSDLQLKPQKEILMVVRGGFDYNSTSEDKPITSTLRGYVPIDKRDGSLGFRLVRSD